ncbi:PREDICTED: uncharacterized protein LOC105149884 [Acromyrmex echinatior]|uniref:uncharacterized protein LOC105149884 n=1 Tax=Acromyrmex echinatior TaxID=103372 RepID=UPI000580F6D6|nr:PREDICTED: uncharacterized protein LOC105149884 [Acromyrmex echinatior]
MQPKSRENQNGRISNFNVKMIFGLCRLGSFNAACVPNEYMNNAGADYSEGCSRRTLQHAHPARNTFASPGLIWRLDVRVALEHMDQLRVCSICFTSEDSTIGACYARIRNS